ncbi:hypothetical protein SLEP1_g33798 [Rubroshorea leprosula]|uniref:Uncharacterized protein n=1 Tax=Rubroshorea leprosula TaxID=152421 RepID=A0AAV5KI06_9ROSI|nr:hypothetical protein SLEP1_g33798 [Rubroshorea leprosula]
MNNVVILPLADVEDNRCKQCVRFTGNLSPLVGGRFIFISHFMYQKRERLITVMEISELQCQSSFAAKSDFYHERPKRKRILNNDKGQDYTMRPMPTLFLDSDRSKYGSVGKEIEALHAEELRIKALGDQRSKIPNPDQEISLMNHNAFAPFAIPAVFLDSDKSKYGSVANEIEALCARAIKIEALHAQKSKFLNPSHEPIEVLISSDKEQSGNLLKSEKHKIIHHVNHNCSISEQASHSEGHSFIQPLAGPANSTLSDQTVTTPEAKIFIDLEDDHDGNDDREKSKTIIFIDSEDEDLQAQRSFHHNQNDFLEEPAVQLLQNDSKVNSNHEIAVMIDESVEPVDHYSAGKVSEEMEIEEDNHQIGAASDCLADFGKNIALLVERAADEAGSSSSNIVVGMSKSFDQVGGSGEVISLPEADIKLDKSVTCCMDDEMDIEENNRQIGAADESLAAFSKDRPFPVECSKVKGSERLVQREDAGSCSHEIVGSISESVDQVKGTDSGEEVKNLPYVDAKIASAEELGSLPNVDVKISSVEKVGNLPNVDVKIASAKEVGSLPNVDVEIASEEELESLPNVDVMSASGEGLGRLLALDAETDERFHDPDDEMVIEKENQQTDGADDDLAHIWKEMAFSMECSKDICDNSLPDKHAKEDDDCEHSFILKDDLGYVCRICGVIQRGIETIFEFVYSKGNKSTRTYASEHQNSNKSRLNENDPDGVKSPEDDSMVTEVSAHPRHWKQMKPHQVEGFNFLCRNLLVDEPGGCILAHAPGSGKTFMIISFIQSFLAKFPQGKPLVILPKGILPTWKKEFQRWQVEDIPLLDFYTSKAENRSQQLDVLRQWMKQKSILFLGYKQFSVIVCDDGSSNKVAADCRDILLRGPSILILDEGHTPRNENTDVVQSLAKVHTPRKVVLSGTLYQNHVKEVFNILNLVRPKFLKSRTSRAIVARIMSRVQIPAERKQLKVGTESAFFDSVEYTLQKDEDFKRKVAVIQDLREMTCKVLHYYKGDFLDELPGLVDLTVVLKLSARQKDEVQKLRKLDKLKRIAVGSAVYVHPELKYFSEKYPATGDKGSSVNDENIDRMLEKLDVKHGVKMKFFLNILGLCESNDEKLLVFSQFILPLKLLERVSVKQKGWRSEKELFMITGDTSSEQRERFMERFNSSPDAKVLFGSIKACGEGISLVGASRILILDVHLNPSVTRQAIGRAFRPGQTKKVYTYRLVAGDSPEEEDYLTCFRKELISKMWFEWNEGCGHQDFRVNTVDVDDCNDPFLESSVLRDDIKVLNKR